MTTACRCWAPQRTAQRCQDFSSLPMCWPAGDAGVDPLDALLPAARAAYARAQRVEVQSLRALVEAVQPEAGWLARLEACWSARRQPHDPLTWAYATVRSRGLQVHLDGRTHAVLAPSFML